MTALPSAGRVASVRNRDRATWPHESLHSSWLLQSVYMFPARDYATHERDFTPGQFRKSKS